jgi:uncharacterized repeat protein (TIGR03803 family)
MEPRISRRRFLAASAAAAGALALPSPFLALARRAAGAKRGPGYGELYPCRDHATGQVLLYLPKRFECWSFGWAGDPLEDGTPTPDRHDGMAVVADLGRELVLVRNHEVTGDGGAFASGAPVYDPAAEGGTVTLRFDTKRKELVGSQASLAGTLTSCAGGPTPWGSWLSCEENVDGPDLSGGLAGLTERHGYVFEVPGQGTATAEPLRAMGRLRHEACAVDPASGFVYETEDEGASGFYRFVPNVAGDLAAGGSLSMLAIAGEPARDMDVAAPGDVFDVEWVPIAEPDPDPFVVRAVYNQGAAGGGANFSRLEGCWHGGGLVYFTATNGGPAGMGQVWSYDPAASKLRLLVSSPHAGVLQGPDNVTVSPRGGVLLCEDASGAQFLQGLSPEGEVFRFAQNRVVLDGTRGFEGDFSASELAGACFSPDGQWLFANVYTPGITVAIRGPWGKGPL